MHTDIVHMLNVEYCYHHSMDIIIIIQTLFDGNGNDGDDDDDDDDDDGDDDDGDDDDNDESYNNGDEDDNISNNNSLISLSQHSQSATISSPDFISPQLMVSLLARHICIAFRACL